MRITPRIATALVIATTGDRPGSLIWADLTEREEDRLTRAGLAQTRGEELWLTRAGWDTARTHAPQVVGHELYPAYPKYLT